MPCNQLVCGQPVVASKAKGSAKHQVGVTKREGTGFVPGQLKGTGRQFVGALYVCLRPVSHTWVVPCKNNYLPSLVW